MPSPSGDLTPVPTEVPTYKPIDAPEAKVSSTAPPIGDRTNLKGNPLTLDQTPSAQLPYSPMRPSFEPVDAAVTVGKPCYQPKSQVQRVARRSPGKVTLVLLVTLGYYLTPKNCSLVPVVIL